MKTILFVDIDGVLSILTQDNAANYEKLGRGLPAWPIPLACQILRLIDQDTQLKPVWLSSWGTESVLWNERAKTRHWPVGYYLSKKQERYAKQVLPTALFTNEKYIDRKLIAAQYYLRKKPATQRVVWIEDGFAEETEQWAIQRGNVRLVDTTEEAVLSLLLATEEAAMRQFIELLKQQKDER